VLIYIGLLEWKDKQHALKPLRGKKLALRIPNTATYSLLRSKAEEKWKSYHSNLYHDALSYELLYEDGQKALFLPGSNELFMLSRYHEELGKDYNRITLYLCTSQDYNRAIDCGESSGSDDIGFQVTKEETLEKPSPKHPRVEVLPSDQVVSDCLLVSDHSSDSNADNSVILQIQQDEELARELQNQSEQEELLPVTFKDTRSLVKAIEAKLDSSHQLFLVVRRGAPFFRLLTLWQREVNRCSAESVLRVSYLGEQGIDSGAMAKEFLTHMILNMGSTMFPEGGPINSTFHVQNGNFRACGQVAAVSLAQGGPAPCFLEESVYNLLINPEVDVKQLSPEKHLTTSDMAILNQVRDDVTAHQEMIIEHGYTGKINQEHVDEIIQSIVISIVTRRVVLMKEFMAGLNLYGVADIVLSNPEICKSLFVKLGSEKGNISANELFSMVDPQYSEPGSSRRQVEEIVMDHLQDFLMSLEDDRNIMGYAFPVTWNYKEQQDNEQHSSQPTEEFETPELTPSGIMGWLTGQKHRPLNGEQLVITAKFYHDCMKCNPNHTICFPRVGSCGREVTFPTAHIKSFEEFQHMFLLAYCKGQAFARP